MKLKKPSFWDYKKPNYLAYILLPLTLIIRINNFFLNKKIKKINDKIKTICVGNIYLGGTGKTPLVIKLNEILKNSNLKIATIKKYYKNQIDEQKLLNQYTKLYCTNKREISLNQAVEDKMNLAIFDDGLQDKSLNYNLKFVCFNSEKWIGNSFLIPAGPLREDLSSIKKYDVVFLNGNENNNLQIKKIIKNHNQKIEIFETNYEIKDLKKFDRNNRYLVFSGIGNPESFLNTLKNNGFNIIEKLNFPDHYMYSNKDIEKIKKLAKNYKAQILTTEKDFIKINQDYSMGINCLKIHLVIKEEEKLIKFLNSKL
tara:strand:+ start:489 stop:1427 length:939 start_codon:yes stop_codon:yes gene_type:complete